MEQDLKPLIVKAKKWGAMDARMMDTSSVIFDSRAFLKCRFGCRRWGKYWTCPPNMELSFETFKEAFDRYQTAMVIQAPEQKKSQEVTLRIEKEAMIAHNCIFAFGMAVCVWCETCAWPDPCRHPDLARPSMDAFGIDIGKTVEHIGFKVEFDKNGVLIPAWYSMVLLD